mmetsp:Transcript_39869/g.107718  ORF Transcript_39869/g.107718 Transcript_39869/m.107718 type:complete len:326 (-) Transcript_39869:168-1145(-)
MGQTCGCTPNYDQPEGVSAERPVQNSAFVFIKPHAVTKKVQDLVRERLANAGIIVRQSNQITADVIDKQGLIDKHYGAIASRAMSQPPSELVVQESAKAEFKSLFGLPWQEALDKGLVFNAKGASAKLGVEPLEISDRFDKLKRGTDQIKFGGGFYVGKVDDIFVVNGFYTRMRAKFTTPGTCIHYFEVLWDPEELPWKKFRAEIVGATDPQKAAVGSIRRTIFEKWQSLGLEAEPNTGDNGVHASASPFEGLVERSNWLGAKASQDAFGRALIAAGLGESLITEWSEDPAVNYDGNKQSLFDLLEDLDAGPCVKKAGEILAANK